MLARSPQFPGTLVHFCEECTKDARQLLTDHPLCVHSLSDGMLRPMTNMPRFPPLDYPARIRALSESVSNSSRNLNNLKAQYELDKAELKASPPRAPYAARKQLHQLGEKQRRIDEQTLAQEAKNHFQQLKAEHKAREAEKDRCKISFASISYIAVLTVCNFCSEGCAICQVEGGTRCRYR